MHCYLFLHTHLKIRRNYSLRNSCMHKLYRRKCKTHMPK